jgi:hypothetical protein
MLCSTARYWDGILQVKQDELLKKCCCEWQAGSLKWEIGAAGLRENCVKLGCDIFDKGDGSDANAIYQLKKKLDAVISKGRHGLRS